MISERALHGPTISVAVKFFARYAELLGTAEATVELPESASVALAVAILRESVENGASLPQRPLTAVNGEHALPDRVLSDGDVLALLPPLAGG